MLKVLRTTRTTGIDRIVSSPAVSVNIISGKTNEYRGKTSTTGKGSGKT
jgi:hypothetical protein